MTPDRRRARALYSQACFAVSCTIGFSVATLVSPSRPHMLPSTVLALIAAGIALLLAIVARFLWRRNQ